MWIVKYSSSIYDDYRETEIFVTSVKSRATKYVTKFNKIHKKWSEHYSQFEENKYGIMNWIKDEHAEQYYDRWNMLRGINRCWCEKIEER